MKKLLGSAAGAALIMVSSLAQANGYIGVNYAQLEQDDRFFGGENFETGEAIARLGGHINPYFAGELRVGTTVVPEEDTEVVTTLETEVRHEYYISAMLRLHYKMGFITPYVAAGVSRVSEKLENSAGSDSSTEMDTSYAAGIDLNFGERWGLNAEYFQLADINGAKRIGPSVGFFFNFH
ncbi:MAG: porin family protein [Alcanivoracaceae bacterium]|nr:porin family protein [Alcanivoracaceae bacterium]